jgi:hypothetical protein
MTSKECVLYFMEDSLLRYVFFIYTIMYILIYINVYILITLYFYVFRWKMKRQNTKNKLIKKILG